MSKGWVIGIISIIVLAGFIVWVFIESTKPLPGQKFSDLGRKHIPVGTEVNYNSNPPTSGDHYADWVKAGIYDTPKDDRNLVHSLEHGYVIMYYRCSVVNENGNLESLDNATPSGQINELKECEDRKNKLASIYHDKGRRKLVLVPRPNLETNFALTAWTYLDKFDGFNEEKVNKFIDAHRDQGPERTKE